MTFALERRISYPDVDEATAIWERQCENANQPITGDMIEEKARFFFITSLITILLY